MAPLRVWYHYHSLSENLIPYVSVVRVSGEDDKVGVGDGALSVQICVGSRTSAVFGKGALHSLFDVSRGD